MTKPTLATMGWLAVGVVFVPSIAFALWTQTAPAFWCDQLAAVQGGFWSGVGKLWLQAAQGCWLPWRG